MKRLLRKGIKWPLIILVIGVSLLFAIQYLRYLTLRSALIKVVAEESHGEYELSLREAEADWWRLVFTFRDARLAPTHPQESRNAFFVEFPLLRIDLGSIQFGRGAQVKIEEFILQEPVIRMQRNHPADSGHRDPGDLPTGISHLFTGLGTLLDNFTIGSFELIRGDFTIARPDSSPLSIRLIDLIVADWNARQIGPSSRLSVSLGDQQFPVPGGHVSFESFRYEFQQRTASLRNVHYTKTDSLTGSRIDVSAKEVNTRRLEYQELRELRYHLRRIEVVDPRIQVRLAVSRENRQHDDRLLGRIVREAIGQVTVDTLVVRNANGHLIFQGHSDSTVVAYEHINLQVSGFQADQETDSVHIAAVKISGGRSRFLSGNRYEIAFDSIAFNLRNRRNFAVFNLTLTDPQSGHRLALAREVRLSRFRLLRLTLYNELVADQLYVGDVKVHAPQRVIFGRRAGQPERPPMRIDLGRAVIENADISIDRGGHRAQIEDIWVSVSNLRKAGRDPLTFTLDRLSLGTAEYRNGDIRFRGSEISVFRDSVAAGSVLVEKDTTVRLLLSDLRVGSEVPMANLSEPGEIRFRSVTVSHTDVRVRGAGPADSSSSSSRRSVVVDRLALSSVRVDLVANKLSLRAEGSDWLAAGLRVGDKPAVEEVAGSLRSVQFATNDISVVVPAFRLNTRIGSVARGIELKRKDGSLHTQVEEISAGEIRDLMGTRTIRKVAVRGIHGTLLKPGFRGTVTADSLTVTDVAAGTEPVAGEVTLYSPAVEGEVLKTPVNGNKKFHLEEVKVPPGLRSVRLLHGSLILQSSAGSVRASGLQLSTNLRNDLRLMVSRLEKPGENMVIALDSFRLHNSDMQVGSLTLLPVKTEEEYMKSEFESSHVAVRLRDIQLTGFRPDSLFLGRQIVGEALVLGSLDVAAFRDQRLPDPPPQPKPFLDALIRKVPVPLNIPSLRIESGIIRAGQISEKHGARGEISFEKLTAEARNISNLPGAEPLLISGDALMYGKAPVKYDYQVKDENHFTFATEVSDLDLTLLNQQTISMARLEILSGHLSSLSVSSEADTARSTGTATITYEDLHIRFINEDRSVLKGLGTELLSLIADRLVIKKDKSDAVATFEQDRLKHKAIFNYWARTGIKGASAAILKGKKRKNSHASR